MKIRIILSGILLFAAISAVQAQRTISPGQWICIQSSHSSSAKRWYAGIEAGVPFAVSTFTSFAEAEIYGGYMGGALIGYRISPLLSLEGGIILGTLRLGAGKCCGDYWLGADGVRYLSAVAGMKSYSYRDIYSSVSMKHCALRLNIDILQITRPHWDKRWSLTLSPAIYGVATTATLKERGSKETIIERAGRLQIGAGAGIGVSYQITDNLGIGFRTGGIWVFGERFDGIMSTDHKENIMWNNSVTLTWRFGSSN